MAKAKVIFGGEWVRVRNLMNGKFNVGKPCSICREFKCVPVWYNINTQEVRCMKCFKPKGY